MRYSSFALATAQVEQDADRGREHEVGASTNLLGISSAGVVYYQAGEHVLWRDFLRAAHAGLYRGDPNRLIVYPYGAAGGPMADGLWETVQWLFENRDVAILTLEAIAAAGGAGVTLVAGERWISGLRRQQIARQWRQQGFTGPRLFEYLSRLPQWDAEQLAKQTQLTALEACLALTMAGCQLSDDGLWRPAESHDAQLRREALEAIERQAEESVDDGWREDFPLEGG